MTDVLNWTRPNDHRSKGKQVTSPATQQGPAVPGGTVTTTGKRGRKPGQVAKVHKEIPFAEFAMEDIAPDDRGFLKRQRIERSKQQIAVDARVLEVKQEWQAAGSPGNWNQMPVKGWVLGKEYEEEALFQLGKGAGLHGLKLIVGKIQRKPLPGLPLPDGKVRIPFCVVTRKTEVTGLPAGSSSASEDSE